MDTPERKGKLTSYRAVLSLWRLASEQIYSRFSSMLIANSIVCALGGILLASDKEISKWFAIIPVCGIVLCVIWYRFIEKGLRVETAYRIREKEIRQDYELYIEELPYEPDNDMGFSILYKITIIIFVIIYFLMFCMMLIQC